MNWKDIAYLRKGNPRQQAAFQVLQSLKVFHLLADYDPVLVGTLPLGIDIPGSDLDILCDIQNLDRFTSLVRAHFGRLSGFRIKTASFQDLDSRVVNFDWHGSPLELFGQPRPVVCQQAYRHMLVEARLLALGGERLRRAIRRLKLAGMKTEPAFARLLGLEGDAFQALLELEGWGEDQLTQLVDDAMQRGLIRFQVKGEIEI